jgi:hypothetical protein
VRNIAVPGIPFDAFQVLLQIAQLGYSFRVFKKRTIQAPGALRTNKSASDEMRFAMELRIPIDRIKKGCSAWPLW